jgi:hypothetical protein
MKACPVCGHYPLSRTAWSTWYCIKCGWESREETENEVELAVRVERVRCGPQISRNHPMHGKGQGELELLDGDPFHEC